MIRSLKDEVRQHVAIVDPETGEPVITLAIEDRQDDGWYPLSTVTVK